MSSLLHRRYLHLVPIEPGECLPSWILRIANRDNPNFQSFSTKWLADDLRVTPGFDAFPAASLLMELGAIRPDKLDHYISRHTLHGTTKLFYTEDEWNALLSTHGAKGSRIYTLRRKAKQQSWHICPICRRLELERGIATWQVLPQVPGSLLCSEHEVPLVLCTSTRIPPLSAPTENDLPLGQERPRTTEIGHQEDHLTLARDIADALAAGLRCLSPGQSLRDVLALQLFGRPWSSNVEVWRTVTGRFGDQFLHEIQVANYHKEQSDRARLHPSFHGIVYLAAVARAYGTNLPDLLTAVNRRI